MKGKIASIVVCLCIAIWLLISGNSIRIGIGISLLAAVVALIVDVFFTALYQYSIFAQMFNLHRIKTYKTEEEAFRSVFDCYKSKDVIQSVIFVGYTADMQARNLQHYMLQNNIEIENLEILIKHPVSISESVVINNLAFPAFPMVNSKIQNRRNEVTHSLNEIKGLINRGFVRSCKAKGYYSLPSIRAVVINKEYGYLSFYVRHTTGGDLSGTTNNYIRISNLSRIEKTLLKGFLEWFAITWDCSIGINNSDDDS